MLKPTLIVASTLLAFVAIGPAQAQMKSECSQAEMTKMNGEMAKMTDKTKKQEAMKEMEMAKDMMAKKDMEGCETHMTKAMNMMK